MDKSLWKQATMHLEFETMVDEKSLDELVRLVHRNLNQKKNAILYLKGDLGSGKTTFVRKFLSIIFPEYKDFIRSPSFTLLNVYTSTNTKIAHYDFYRLPDNLHTASLAVEDLESYHYVFVEWLSKAHEHGIDLDFDFCLEIQNLASDPKKRHYKFFKKPRIFLTEE